MSTVAAQTSKRRSRRTFSRGELLAIVAIELAAGLVVWGIVSATR
jgi:hypothetical protein